MHFGNIDNLVIFGGGQRSINFISAAVGYKVLLVSAPRLLSSELDQEKITVEAYVKRERIPYVSVETLNAFDPDRYITNTTLGISFGAPWIFRKQFIEKFDGRLINGHGAPLPKYRGAATFCWQIMRGDRTGRHLFHLVDEGLDSGPIILAQSFTFPETCRIPADYKAFYQSTEVEFFNTFLKLLKENAEFDEIHQDEKISTYFPRLSTSHHGFIDWQWDAQNVERFICAFDRPYEGASTFLDGVRVFLRNVSLDQGEGEVHPFMAGLIIRKELGVIIAAVRDSALCIREVRDETGINIMERIRVGTRFATPYQYLDAARSFKAVYDARGLKL